jgi:hypothetical protein
MLYEWMACNSLAKAILELSLADFLRPRFTLEPQTIDRHPWGFMAMRPTLPRYKHVTIEEGISFRAAEVATPAEFAMVIQWKAQPSPTATCNSPHPEILLPTSATLPAMTNSQGSLAAPLAESNPSRSARPASRAETATSAFSTRHSSNSNQARRTLL